VCVFTILCQINSDQNFIPSSYIPKLLILFLSWMLYLNICHLCILVGRSQVGILVWSNTIKLQFFMLFLSPLRAVSTVP
jgi:hypothetical protein